MNYKTKTMLKRKLKPAVDKSIVDIAEMEQKGYCVDSFSYGGELQLNEDVNIRVMINIKINRKK